MGCRLILISFIHLLATELVNCQETCEYLAEFQQFKTQYKKHYDHPVDEQKAYEAFEENFKYIKLHNILHKEGKFNFTLRINAFSDMKPHEFTKLKNCFVGAIFPRNDSGYTIVFPKSCRDSPCTLPIVNIPDEIDWRQRGAVTKVVNQLDCNACWAFSAAGALESRKFIKDGGELVPLSVQNLVDCSSPHGNKGCRGGTAEYAFAYIDFNEGIDTEEFYPYTAKEGECKFSESHIGATISNFRRLLEISEEILQQWVAEGPVSAAIDASHTKFIDYDGGIHYDEECSSTKLTHYVLIVGYGVDKGEEYWLVKNVYGEEWGEKGYIRMARNRGNNCGIASEVSKPVLPD